MVENEFIMFGYFCNYVCEVVNFFGGLVFVQQFGVIDEKIVWFEVGFYLVLVGMVKVFFGVVIIVVLIFCCNEGCYRILFFSLCILYIVGLNVDFNEFYCDFSELVCLFDLFSYLFDEKNYWLQYIGDWCLFKNCVGIQVGFKVIEVFKFKLFIMIVQKIIKEEVNGDVVIFEIEFDFC